MRKRRELHSQPPSCRRTHQVQVNDTSISGELLVMQTLEFSINRCFSSALGRYGERRARWREDHQCSREAEEAEEDFNWRYICSQEVQPLWSILRMNFSNLGYKSNMTEVLERLCKEESRISRIIEQTESVPVTKSSFAASMEDCMNRIPQSSRLLAESEVLAFSHSLVVKYSNPHSFSLPYSNNYPFTL